MNKRIGGRRLGLLGEESSDLLALVAAEGVVQEGEAEADDGAGEEAAKDELLLDLDLRRRSGEKKCGQSGKRDDSCKHGNGNHQDREGGERRSSRVVCGAGLKREN